MNYTRHAVLIMWNSQLIDLMYIQFILCPHLVLTEYTDTDHFVIVSDTNTVHIMVFCTFLLCLQF